MLFPDFFFFLNTTSHTTLHLCQWSRFPSVSAVTLQGVEFHDPCVNLRGLSHLHGRVVCGLPLAPGLSTSVLGSLASLQFCESWGYDFAETTDFSNFPALMWGSQPSVQKPVLWKEPQPENHRRFVVPTLCQFPCLLFHISKMVAGTESFLKTLKPMKRHNSSMTATSLHFHASPKTQLDSVNSHPPRSETVRVSEYQPAEL